MACFRLSVLGATLLGLAFAIKLADQTATPAPANGLDESKGSKLNKRMFEPDESKNENTGGEKKLKVAPEKCMICFEKMKTGEKTVSLPCHPVTNQIHEECLRLWLEKKEQCPTCREDTKWDDSFRQKMGQLPTVAAGHVKALGDESWKVRYAAAKALKEAAFRSNFDVAAKSIVAEALGKALGDEDSNVRYAAASALTNAFSSNLDVAAKSKVAEALEKAVGDENFNVRRAVAEALKEASGSDFDVAAKSKVEEALA